MNCIFYTEMSQTAVVDSLDIALYLDKVPELADDKKYQLLTNHWKPHQLYQFPITVELGHNRRFNPAWLKSYPWLAYSPSVNGAFCLPCVLFGMQVGHNSSKLNRLYRSPLSTWVSATTKLFEHNNRSEFHRKSVAFASAFKAVQEKTLQPIHLQVNKSNNLFSLIFNQHEILAC